MKKLNLILMVFLVFFTLSCGKKTVMDISPSASEAYTSSKAENYFRISSKIIVEVYYEPGAEPFAGNTANGTPYWKILEDNLKAVLKYRSSIPLIVVPKDLTSMTPIPAQGKTKWTPDELIELNGKYKEADSTADVARFYVYFLNGNSNISNSIIAESVNGTPVIGVYKSVVTASGSSIVQRYVEQSTIIHEIGHALGFVNNGVPMKANYQDTTNGSHSKNSDCVMYWMNEGASDLMGFVSRILMTGNNVMWGPEILADAEAFSK